MDENFTFHEDGEMNKRAAWILCACFCLFITALDSHADELSLPIEFAVETVAGQIENLPPGVYTIAESDGGNLLLTPALGGEPTIAKAVAGKHDLPLTDPLASWHPYYKTTQGAVAESDTVMPL
jgi:hypothetical protein